MMEPWRVEMKRYDAERCPKCGSENAGHTDWIVINEDGDEAPAGIMCDDCGYDVTGGGKVLKSAPYLAPGEPGSHDQSSDYST